MPKPRSPRTIEAPNPWVPREVREQYDRLRSDVQAVLGLVDTSDPSWPSVAVVLREFADAGIGIDATSVAIAVKLGKHRHLTAPEPRTSRAQLTLASTAESIVYYARRGDFVKIGWTTAPRGRFGNINPDEILAIEPGGRWEEAQRHRQFRHLRQSGEYFHAAPELLEHAQQIRLLHGDPDPSWRTMAHTHAQPQRRLPPPASPETMTAAEAVTELGIKNGTVRGWTYRGVIEPIGRNSQGHLIFYREHLIHLRDNPRRKRPQGL